jgi:hypothetical protein
MRVKEIIAACLLSSLVAGTAVAITAPSAANGAGAVTVERSSKSDRLPQAPVVQPTDKNSDTATKTETPRKATPFGCDPAFSPVAEPSRAYYYNRCMV